MRRFKSMSILGIASTLASSLKHPPLAQKAGQTKGQGFSQLAQSLKTGDLAGAQQAFSSFKSATSVLQQNASALSKALSSGDLTQARNAFSKFQQDAYSTGAPGLGSLNLFG